MKVVLHFGFKTTIRPTRREQWRQTQWNDIVSHSMKVLGGLFIGLITNLSLQCYIFYQLNHKSKKLINLDLNIYKFEKVELN